MIWGTQVDSARLVKGWALAMVLALPGMASAGLIDRGNGLIYDDELDITWLQDANYAYTSGFAAANAVDNGSSALNNIVADGRMGWEAAIEWAEALEFGGYDDWRLPFTLQPDPTCSQQVGSPPQGLGSGCTGSELGHLFNAEGVTYSAPGPFINVRPSYMSETEFALDPAHAWNFNFINGIQRDITKSAELFAWAVRSGDVEVKNVPEPGSLMLLSFGLGLMGLGRRARRHSVLR